jgi:hypothetical protein
MGRNLGWIAVVVFAVSWFLPVHQMQELGSVMGSMGEAFGKIGQGMAESMGGEVKKTTPDLGGAFDDAPGNYSGPPGWKAFRFAFDMLTDAHKGETKDGFKSKLLGATSLTNGVMLLAILMLLLSPRGLSGFVGVLLLLCAGLNLSWIYLNLGEDGFIDGLRLGYYLWAGSFVLAAIAGFQPRTHSVSA